MVGFRTRLDLGRPLEDTRSLSDGKTADGGLNPVTKHSIPLLFISQEEEKGKRKSQHGKCPPGKQRRGAGHSEE